MVMRTRWKYIGLLTHNIDQNKKDPLNVTEKNPQKACNLAISSLRKASYRDPVAFIKAWIATLHLSRWVKADTNCQTAEPEACGRFWQLSSSMQSDASSEISAVIPVNVAHRRAIWTNERKKEHEKWAASQKADTEMVFSFQHFIELQQRNTQSQIRRPCWTDLSHIYLPLAEKRR